MYKRWFSILLVLMCLTPLRSPAEVIVDSSGYASRGNLQYEYGDMFEASLYDSEGREVSLSDKPTLVIYGSIGCGACLTLTSNLTPLIEIFGDEYVEIRIVWRDEIPMDHIEMRQLPLSINHTLAGKTDIAGTKPTLFIVDATGMVLFRDIDQARTIQKLLSMGYFPEGYLKERADQYLISKMNVQQGKTPLLYFCMSGCVDCIDVDKAIEANAEMAEAFTIDRLYRHDEQEPSRWIDHFKLLATVYGVTWYPSFLVFEAGVSTLIGETPVDTLCQTLLDTIEKN